MTRSCRCGCGQALTAIETAPRTGGRTVVSLSMSPVRTDTHQPVFRMCLRVCEYPGPSSAEWEGWADGGGRAAKSEGHSRPVRAGGGWSSLRWWKGIDPTQAFQQVAQVGPLTARPPFPRCPLLPGRGLIRTSSRTPPFCLPSPRDRQRGPRTLCPNQRPLARSRASGQQHPDRPNTEITNSSTHTLPEIMQHSLARLVHEPIPIQTPKYSQVDYNYPPSPAVSQYSGSRSNSDASCCADVQVSCSCEPRAMRLPSISSLLADCPSTFFLTSPYPQS